MRKQSFGGFGSKVGGSLGSIIGKRLGSLFGRKAADKYLPGFTWKLGSSLFPGLPLGLISVLMPFFKKMNKPR